MRRRRRLSRSAHTSRWTEDDHDHWMNTFSTRGDDEIDALLAGTSPAGSDLAPVGEVVRALRGLAAGEPAPAMSASLRAQLDSPIVVAMGIRRARRAELVKAAVVAVAAAVALVAVGASQNRLPTAIQNVVSSTADLVGVDVPRSDERGAGREDLDSSDPGGVEGNAEGHDGNSTVNGANDGTPGYDGVTPGGSDPADPGTAGDHEPATPAVPPADSNGGGGGDSQPKPDQATTTTTTVPRGQSNGPKTTEPTGPPAEVDASADGQ